ncbi:MAG: hypothetical protein IH851_07985 [Armatimonadetes bacterium]|nr:hypothetical protein [Armatimonadota bacterium]
MNRTIEDRLARLERANRRLTFFCAALVVLPMLVVAGWRAQVPDVIRAHSFEVVGEDGNVKGRLWHVKNVAALSLYDSKGVARIDMNSPDGSPRIRVMNDEGQARAVLEVSAGRAGLRLLDPGDKTRLDLSTGPPLIEGEGPRLNFYTKKGKLEVTLLGGGTPIMHFNDSDGNPRIILAVLNDPEYAGIMVMGKDFSKQKVRIGNETGGTWFGISVRDDLKEYKHTIPPDKP